MHRLVLSLFAAVALPASAVAQMPPGMTPFETTKVTDQPVEYVVYSHEHWDRVTGGRIFRDEGARFISHAQCIDEFKRKPSPIVIIPEGTYKKRFDIELGGKTLELALFRAQSRRMPDRDAAAQGEDRLRRRPRHADPAAVPEHAGHLPP